MKILKAGILPKTDIFNGRCHICGAIIECEELETHITEVFNENSERMGGDLRHYIKCPTENCSCDIRVFKGKYIPSFDEFYEKNIQK